MHSALTTRSAFHFAAFAGSFSCSFFASAEALTPVCAARKSSPSAREIGAKYCSASSDSIGSRLAGGRLPADMERLITSGRLSTSLRMFARNPRICLQRAIPLEEFAAVPRGHVHRERLIPLRQRATAEDGSANMITASLRCSVLALMVRVRFLLPKHSPN